MRISKCSRLSLSTCGERTTVYLRISVGSGTGPRTFACVRRTVSTIFFVDWSMTSWSYALRRMRIFWPDGVVQPIYLMILTTRPEPTVRPPSRIANRRPSSIAIGLPNSTVISVLSPGITISVPSGNATVPVTSVVRK